MSTAESSPAPDSPSVLSDKENHHSTLALRDKGKLPEGSSKRKRTMTNRAAPSGSRRRTQEPVNDDDEDFDYNPDQSLEERRKVQRGLRNLIKDITENKDEYLQADSTGLHETLQKANQYSSNIKQTAEAAIDSRLLVGTADLSYQKVVRLTSGNAAQGIDVDEFVSKCITYMRQGGGIIDDEAQELSSTQRRRRRSNLAPNADGEVEFGDEGDMFNWEHLGRFACLPHIRRPAVSGFLLGPLSVEKKVRKITKRSAPFRPGNLRETRPEVLDVDAVQRNEKNDLTAICAKTFNRLRDYQAQAQEALSEEVSDETTAVQQEALFEKHGIRTDGGVDLLRFVVNPRSFGQTVENMFYVSFLIRDGKVGLALDDDQLASLYPLDGNQEPGGGKHGPRHQAVLSMDMTTWREVIEVFGIKESIIEHREEEVERGPGARGWYS